MAHIDETPPAPPRPAHLPDHRPALQLHPGSPAVAHHSGAVSRQIAGLEEHLGYALFQRQARGLSLTREGQDWLPRVQQIFALIEQGVREVGRHSATLQLKAPTCVMRWLLPRLMEWQALRPDVPVELTTTVQHGVDFRREGFDAAVVYGALPNGDCKYASCSMSN